MKLLQQITAALAEAQQRSLHYLGQHSVHGGDINQSYQLQTQEGTLFVKLNHTDRLAMFEAEAAALTEIGRTATLRVPQPLLYGTLDTHAYLVLEHIEFGPATTTTEAALGRRLAQLHRVTAEQFC